MSKYEYPPTHIDEFTGRKLELVEVFPNYGSYMHPNGYRVSYSPFDLGLIKTKEMLLDSMSSFDEDTKKLLGFQI